MMIDFSETASAWFHLACEWLASGALQQVSTLLHRKSGGFPPYSPWLAM